MSGYATRELRVCHLIQYFEVGGIERLVLNLGSRMRELQVATTAIAYAGEGPFRDAFRKAGVPTWFFPTSPGIQLRLVPQLARFLSEGGFQILHSHHVGPFLYGGAAARLAGIAHVHTEHSRELYDTPWRRMLGRLMPALARVVTVSDELAEWRRANFGDRPEVVANGVAQQSGIAPAALPVEDGAQVVVTVARLAPEKDHITLLRGFAQACVGRTVELILVGAGPERAAIEAEIQSLGLENRVKLLGSRDDVGSVLAASHVFALSSRREGLPLALLEALAAGLPVVATGVGEIPTVVSQSIGRVVPPGDPAALGRALAEVLDDAAFRKAAAGAGQSLVRARYDEDQMLVRYAEIYRELV